MATQVKKADLTRPRKTLEALYRKRLKPSRLEDNSPYKKVSELMRGDWQRNREDKKGFYEFLINIARRKGYEIYYEAEALLEVYFQASKWLKSPKGWMPKEGQSAEEMLESLVQYLFVQYKVPKFMNAVWRMNDRLHISWFIHLAQGHNIRTAPGLYASLTKKMAHCFLQASEHYSIQEALIYGQVTALGGEETLLKQLLNTHLNFIYRDQELWLALVQFFLKYSELTEGEKIGQIVEYINARRRRAIKIDDYGQLVEDEVPKKFSIKGKTAESLMKEIQLWQRLIANNIRPNRLITWEPARVKSFLYRAKHNSQKASVYRIMQLTNNYALMQEGEKMKHCVSAYLERCQSGDTSIWALTMTNSQGVKPLLTIQVHDAKTIVQVRGKTNRMPQISEGEIVRLWAAREGLKIANYCELNQ